MRQFDPAHAVEISATDGQRIRLQKVLSADAVEVRLYCHSPGREQKELAIVARLTQRFEQGLAKPRGEQRLVKITERVGRLKQKCRGIAQHYRIEYQTDDSGKKITALTWTKEPIPGTQMRDPGVYCLRSNETSWSEEQLWRTKAFGELQSHYLFEDRFGRPAKGNDKGTPAGQGKTNNQQQQHEPGSPEPISTNRLAPFYSAIRLPIPRHLELIVKLIAVMTPVGRPYRAIPLVSGLKFTHYGNYVHLREGAPVVTTRFAA